MTTHRRGAAALVAGLAATLLAAAATAQPTPPAPATPPAPQSPPAAERATRHALIIGIGRYADPEVPVLRGVVHDVESARRMARAMGVPDGQVTLLRDGEATAAGILDAIAALQARVADGDRVFVYYSGHGTRWYEETQTALGRSGACHEGLLSADGQALTNGVIGEALAPLARRADKMLVFYDACFSGGLAGALPRTRSLRGGDAAIAPKFTPAGAAGDRCAQPSNYRQRSLAGVLQQRQALPQNVVHVAASAPDELSFDHSAIGGFATVAWRDCLLGQARDLDGSGAVTVDELRRCAQARLDQSLAGQPDILGQTITVVGNPSFVPAWAAAGSPGPGAAAAVRPSEILAELHRQRDGSREVVASVRRSRLRIGVDALELDVTAARDGHLYVALAGSDGQSLYLLYPNELAPDNRVRAGQRISLPGAGWEIVAGGPPGPETLLVMVSDAPRDLARLSRQAAGPFTKSLLDESGRARLQGVLVNGTPAAGCGRPGGPSCSDAFGAALLQIETVP